MTDENASQLRVVCVHCRKVREPDVYSTAGPLCHRCVRSATRVERLITIGGVLFRQILKKEESKASAGTDAKEGKTNER